MNNTSSFNYNLGLAFYSVAREYSGSTALRYPDGAEFSYGALDKLSNQVARFLQSHGLKAGDVVAIFNDKSLYGYALMLACLKTGIIYTNLDNNSPWARIRKIIDTCQPALICFDNIALQFNIELEGSAQQSKRVNIRLEETLTTIKELSSDPLPETAAVHGNTPAYIMFTSGSTGFPKGAVMSHSNLLNFIQWSKQTFAVNSSDVFTNVNPIYFDNSVFDFYSSLFNGASLVPIDQEVAKEARRLVQTINKARCTIWFSVPSLLVYLLTNKALTPDDFPTVSRILFGGEGFPKNKLRQLFNLYGSRVALHNVYGPTECTCICSSYRISETDFDNMNELAPLGLIAPNFGYELIKQDGGEDEVGELGLSGPCVGLGYYNDQDRTEKSFVQNPSKKFSERMYKTGDLVERSAGGLLHFRGRVDNQIKHMGYRIELEEIESAFSSLGYVDEVGVVYHKLSPELGFIKAFVSVAADVEVHRINEEIKKLLPAYMVPKTIELLPVLPKNNNGKIDRNKLKEMTK